MSNDGYLFVYGTLRWLAVRMDAGKRAFDQLTGDASFIKPAAMCGQLFAVDDYPGACYQPGADMRITSVNVCRLC